MTNLDNIIAELDESMGWERLFREIKLTSAGYDISCKSARLPENRGLNRYRDVSPYDHNRVKLLSMENDYINGSLIPVPNASRRYILAQGPLNHTAGHFWLMVWEQNSAAVIMLNKIIEKGAVKCSQYYPTGDEPIRFTDTGFTVTSNKQQVNPNYTVRYLALRNDNSGEVRNLYQFHYTAWPDFGVPESPRAFLDFLYYVRDHGVLSGDVGPAIIHCSAGIGRSGTFVLVDTCLIYIERNIPCDVKETLLELRKYRMGLIQTPYQLRFSYCAIAEGSTPPTDPGCDSDDFSSNAEDFDTSDNDLMAKDLQLPKQELQSRGRKRPGSNENADYESKKERQLQNYTNPKDDAIADMPTVPPPLPPRRESLSESNNNVEDTQLRKRISSERQELLRHRVHEMKTKMKKSEQKYKRYSWLPYVVGGSVLITVCTAAVYYYTR